MDLMDCESIGKDARLMSIATAKVQARLSMRKMSMRFKDIKFEKDASYDHKQQVVDKFIDQLN